MHNLIDNHIISIVIHPYVEPNFGSAADFGSDFGGEFEWVDYTVEIQATDLGGPEDDDDAEPVTIGRAFAFRINIASAGLADDALTVADEPSDEVYEVVRTLQLDKMLSNPKLTFPGVSPNLRPTNEDILHLEAFVIDEAWEGKGVDLLAAELIIRNLGHGANITMVVGDGPEDGTDTTVREQTTRHWARIGLTPYPTDPYILWHPCGYARRPL